MSLHVPVGHIYLLWGKCLGLLPIFLIFLLLLFFDNWVVSCLYALKSKPISVASFAGIFSHSVSCLFVLFMVSFAVQKLLSLIKAYLFIFASISFTLGDWSKKILLQFCLCFPLKWKSDCLPLLKSSKRVLQLFCWSPGSSPRLSWSGDARFFLEGPWGGIWLKNRWTQDVAEYVWKLHWHHCMNDCIILLFKNQCSSICTYVLEGVCMRHYARVSIDIARWQTITLKLGLPWFLSGREPACQCRCQEFSPWCGKLPHTAVHQASLSFTISWSLLKFISLELVMPIQASHPLSSPSPPALNLSQHPSLFQWLGSSHQVVKVLELQLQHQCFQWIFRVDFL